LTLSSGNGSALKVDYDWKKFYYKKKIQKIFSERNVKNFILKFLTEKS